MTFRWLLFESNIENSVFLPFSPSTFWQADFILCYDTRSKRWGLKLSGCISKTSQRDGKGSSLLTPSEQRIPETLPPLCRVMKWKCNCEKNLKKKEKKSTQQKWVPSETITQTDRKLILQYKKVWPSLLCRTHCLRETVPGDHDSDSDFVCIWKNKIASSRMATFPYTGYLWPH